MDAPLEKRKKVVISEIEASNWVKDGMAIAIGGFINSSHPMAIVRQIIKKGIKNLTVIGAASSGLDVDLLIGAGCVKKVISPYVGAEGLAPIGPCFRHAAEKGNVEVWEIDEAMYYAGLNAATQMLPFMPTRAGIGTCYPEVNKDLRAFNDPIKGETLLAIPAIEPEIAIIHAAYADEYGNVQHLGTGFGDRAQAQAADRVIVQAEKIISNDEIKINPLKTSIPWADAVVRAPFGAHPFSSPGFYIEDVQHITEYLTSASEFVKYGNFTAFEKYLDKYIYGPETHVDYLEQITLRKLFSLFEY
jgi:glutaconate CoA-transferase subunit A